MLRLESLLVSELDYRLTRDKRLRECQDISELIYNNLLSESQTVRLHRSIETYIKRSELLNRDPLPNNLEETLVMAAYLEEKKTAIEDEQLRNGYVIFTYGSQKKAVRLDKTKTWHNYELLVINDFLRSGYLIKEVIGSHYEFWSPSGKIAACTMPNHCDCHSYMQQRKCDHVTAIRYLTNNYALSQGLTMVSDQTLIETI